MEDKPKSNMEHSFISMFREIYGFVFRFPDLLLMLTFITQCIFRMKNPWNKKIELINGFKKFKAEKKSY